MALTDTARLVASLELVDKFSKPIANIERSMGRLEKRSSILSRGLGTAFGLAIDRAARATVGLGKSVITTAISFEESFAGVRKTVEATDAQLATLEQSFRDAAKETGIAFEELSRIGQIAGALGVTTDAIDEFSLAVAKASTATGLSVDELADSLGRVGNILSLDESTYETFLSTLVELGNKGASTEGEILEITKRFAATGKQAGLTTPQILGLSSAIAGLGVEPEAAGSALSRLMSNFITETAAGSDKAKEFAKVSGDSFKDFAKIVETDTLGAVLKFADGLSGLSKFERFQALKDAGITNVRDRNAVLLFAGAIDEVTRQLDLANDEFGQTNALSEEFRKRQETTAVQMDILKANLRDVANTIGSAVLPKINELSKEFVDFLNQKDTQAAIKEFAEGLPAVIDDLVGIAKGIPWEAIGASAKLMGTGARALLSAFQGLPDWVQTAVLTGWGLNKLTGGALGSLTGQLVKGLLPGGALRGGTPATPLFTKEVGLGGVGGGAGGASLLGRVGGVLGFVGVVAAAVEGLHILEEAVDGVGFAASKEGHSLLDNLFGGPKREEGAATPIGQFNPANRGGVQNVHVNNAGEFVDEGLFKSLGIQIRANEKGVRAEVKAGHLHQARLLERNADRLNKLRGTFEVRINQVATRIGLVSTALSRTNRNLDEGNRNQREVARRVSEARDRIGNGFQRANDQLGALNRKDFSPKVNVAVNATTSVSISDVVRSVTHASFASQIGHGFTPENP